MTLFVNVLLDRSGSMESLTQDVIGHYNEYVEGLKQLDDHVFVSLSIFDTEYDEVYKNVEAKDVKRLTKDVYFARGGTALLDGVGRLITSAESVHGTSGNKVIFVINTDGEENSSREFTKAKVKALVEKHPDWQFVFVGSGLDNFHEAGAIGIYVHLNSSHTTRGVDYRWQTLSSATAGYSGGSSASMGEALADLPSEEEFAKSNSTSNPN